MKAAVQGAAAATRAVIEKPGHRAGRAGELVGSMAHASDDERCARLNDVVCAVVGEVRPSEVVVDVAERVGTARNAP